MVLPATVFVVERARLLQVPSVGQTRYLIKVTPTSGPDLGNGKYRFSNTIPRRLSDNAQIVRGYLGTESPSVDIYACGRWSVTALGATHLTLTRIE